MNDQWIIQALSVVVAAFGGTTLLLYWFVVCPKLYRHGATFPTGLAFWRYFGDLHDYKEIVAAEAHKPTLYFVIIFLTWATFFVSCALFVNLWKHVSQAQSARRRPW